MSINREKQRDKYLKRAGEKFKNLIYRLANTEDGNNPPKNKER